MNKLFTLLLTILITGCSGHTDDQIKDAQAACKKFVHKEVADKYQDETHVFDTYSKNGKIVVEVGYRPKDEIDRKLKGSDSYMVRLCVYDDEAGRISLPGIYNMEEWRK